MKIAHLCSYYIGSKVHAMLFEALESSVSNQAIYVPVRAENEKQAYKSELLESRINYRSIIKPYHRYLYKTKIRCFLSDYFETYRKDEIESIDCFHAHTLFTDGGLAYELHRLTGKPYVVTVRNTDVNIFLKYAFHLHGYIKKVVDSAAKIVFVSPAMEELFFKYFDRKAINDTCVVPSGIDPFWFLSGNSVKQNTDISPRILFVGNINKNKNPLLLAHAFENVLEKYPASMIKFVGPQGCQSKKLDELSRSIDSIEVVGSVRRKHELKKYYQWANIFAMVSHTETFGLVYVEALSQGLPLVYSKGQGFDGFFPDREVGVSCDSKSISEVSSALIEVFEHGYLQAELISASGKFTWDSVSQKYIDIYMKAVI